MLTLVIGGARSGKSRFAQSLGAQAQEAVYIATLRPEDSEMQARVAQHQLDRPPHWTTVEAPLDIATAVAQQVDSDFILVDCLTLWLSNLCWEHRGDRESEIESASIHQLCAIRELQTPAHIGLVTNEVGYGIVPDSPVARFFRDLQGRVNQEAARLSDQVYQVVAGIPIRIKPQEPHR
jgi:adenosylcobinamide kinase / adenosylcobinamide-phosphate guanylyltransferase